MSFFCLFEKITGVGIWALVQVMITLLIPCIFVSLSLSNLVWAKQEDWNKIKGDAIKKMPVITIKNALPASLGKDQAKNFSITREADLDLSIEKAVMEALQNNRDLTIQGLESVKAGSFEIMEQALFDPELFADISYLRENSLDVSKTGNDRIVAEDTRATALGVRKLSATGTTVETVLSHEQIRSDDTDSPDEHKSRMGISLTQSLLKGFGSCVNLVRVKQAQINTAVTIQELKGFIETLVSQTETAYWQYVLAKQKIVIFEQSLAIAKNQLNEIEQQIAVGILPRTEAAAARSELALRDQDLINAQSLMEERRLKLIFLISSQDGVWFDLGLNLTSKPDIDFLPLPDLITDLADRIILAEKHRCDLNEARLRLKNNNLETIVTQNGLLPRLDFFMALGRTGYTDFFRNQANDFELNLTFSQAIGNRLSKAKNQAAEALRLQAEAAVENLVAMVGLDVRLAVNELQRMEKQIKATRTTRIFQEQTYGAEKDRFNVGSSTALLVAQAQRDLLAARIAEVEAIVNFRISLVRLYLAQGILLEMRGISISSQD